MNPKKFLEFLILALTCVCMSGCGQQDDASALIKKANGGDKEAQYKLGVLLERTACSEGRAAAASCFASSFDEGMRHSNISKQFRSEALSWLEKSAIQGHPDAQIIVGLMLLRAESYKSAVEFLSKSTECSNTVQHRAFAYCWLGWCHEKGYGVSQNYEEALRLYTLSSDEGCLEATYELASAYYEGKIAPRDVSKAMPLFQLYVEQFVATNVLYNVMSNDFIPGSPAYEVERKMGESALTLGDICASGECGIKNMEEAAKWWQIAVEKGDNDSAKKKLIAYNANRGDPESQYQMAIECQRIYKSKNSWQEEVMKPHEAQAELKRWLLLAAEQGHVGAQLMIGNPYTGSSYGDDRPYNDSVLFSRQERITWLRAAAIQGNEDAQYQLGEALFEIDLVHRRSDEKTSENSQELYEAYAWMNLVATYQNFKVSEAYSYRKRILSKIPQEQVNEVQRISREYIEKYAKKRP